MLISIQFDLSGQCIPFGITTSLACDSFESTLKDGIVKGRWDREKACIWLELIVRCGSDCHSPLSLYTMMTTIDIPSSIFKMIYLIAVFYTLDAWCVSLLNDRVDWSHTWQRPKSWAHTHPTTSIYAKRLMYRITLRWHLSPHLFDL